jgi:hypothetical protein
VSMIANSIVTELENQIEIEADVRENATMGSSPNLMIDALWKLSKRAENMAHSLVLVSN